MLYKIRINQNSLLSPTEINNFFNKITNKMKKYGKLKYFYNVEIGKKLKNKHVQGWCETELELTSRQIQYHKTKQKLKDQKNCHQITPCTDSQDAERYRAYCTKDVTDLQNVQTSLSEDEIKEQMTIWKDVYVPQRITKPKKNLRAPEKLMLYLKQNEKNFIPCGDACLTYSWHAELLKEILNYYKIECIFLDSYIVKKAMCLALLTYDPEYAESLLQEKWEEYIEVTKKI